MSVKEAVAPELRAQAAQDLRAGAEHIGHVGWAQGRLADTSEISDLTACPVCAVGGINYAIFNEPRGMVPVWATVEQWEDLNGRSVRASSALAAHLGIDDLAVPGWNDQPGRSKAEVVSAMFAAAAALEAAE